MRDKSFALTGNWFAFLYLTVHHQGIIWNLGNQVKHLPGCCSRVVGAKKSRSYQSTRRIIYCTLII